MDRKATTIHAGLAKYVLRLDIFLALSSRCSLEFLDITIITAPYHWQVYF